jgi:hypothetical protein
MKPITCSAARRRLPAYHDGELSVDDQLLVAAHVDWCDECAAALDDLALVGAALRASSPGRRATAADEWATLPSSVVARFKAERTLAFSASLRRMFEDLHFVYAGGAAACAALLFTVVMLGTMKLVGTTRPHSLAALVAVLTPGSNHNPVVARANLQMPKPLDQEFAPLVAIDAGTDTVFALSATVTREGRVASLELLRAEADRYLGEDEADARAVAGLLEVMAKARFEPANVGGLPVAVNMVWLVAHTTVRGQLHTPDTAAPATAIDGRRGASLKRPVRRPLGSV